MRADLVAPIEQKWVAQKCRYYVKIRPIDQLLEQKRPNFAPWMLSNYLLKLGTHFGHFLPFCNFFFIFLDALSQVFFSKMEDGGHQACPIVVY